MYPHLRASRASARAVAVFDEDDSMTNFLLALLTLGTMTRSVNSGRSDDVINEPTRSLGILRLPGVLTRSHFGS